MDTLRLHWDYMKPKTYLPIGLIGIVILIIAVVGLNNPFHSLEDNTTKIMVSLDTKESSTLFLAYKPTNELFSSNGMTVNFTENKTGPTTIKCNLTCQPTEGNIK